MWQIILKHIKNKIKKEIGVILNFFLIAKFFTKSSQDQQKKIKELEETSRKNSESLHMIMQIMSHQYENLPYKMNDSNQFAMN